MSGFVLRGGITPRGNRVDLLIEGDRVAPLERPDVEGRNRVLDADGLVVAPGFVDLQVNGAAGHDITSDPSSVWAVGEALTAYGVTAFLPTIVTSPPATIAAAQIALSLGPPPGYHGARPLGLHLEGPFLNPKRSGVHDPALLREPDLDLVSRWSIETGVRLVTLAPELPGALVLVRDLVSRGILVAAGHSAATLVEGQAGIESGIRYATHLWNAMPPLEHRAPGLVGALLLDDRVTVGLIADGVHLDPSTVDLSWRAAGAGRVSLVTDAISALGPASGEHRIGGATIVIEAGGARAGGHLAGGLLGLDGIVRNLVVYVGASVADAIATVTLTPSRLLGLPDRHDTVQPGDAADLTVLTNDLDVAATIISGRVVYADAAHAGWLASDPLTSLR